MSSPKEALPVFGYVYAEERFGRNVVRVSGQKIEGGHELVLKKDATALLSELRAEVERLKGDAERWRWIEDNATSHGGGHGFTLQVFVPHDMEDWGCAIDEAIRAARTGAAGEKG